MQRESAETIVSANGVDLCVEDLGDATDPPLLLVAGASYPRWEPLGEPRRQTVGAGSTLDLTAAGDV